MVDTEARASAEEALRAAEEAVRLLRALEVERRGDREANLEIQLGLRELATKLDLLLDGRIHLGGRSK